MYPEPTLVFSDIGLFSPEQFRFPTYFTQANGSFYFTTDDSSPGSGYGNPSSLWQVDGNDAGATLIKTLDRPVRLIADNLLQPIDVAGNVYFRANPPSQTRPFEVIEISNDWWRTDGTTKNTVPVQVPGDLSQRYLVNVTPVGNSTYFARGSQLWKTDTLLEDAKLVYDYAGEIQYLGAFGNKLLVHDNNNQIWLTDGTDAGNKRLISLDSIYAYHGVDIVGDSIFISGLKDNQYQLWISNGVAESNTLLMTSKHPFGRPYAVGHDIYFEVFDLSGSRYRFDLPDRQPLEYVVGRQLWKTDGTVKGTSLVKKLETLTVPYLIGGLLTDPYDETFKMPWGNELLFNDAGTWWRTNTTPEGTKALGYLTRSIPTVLNDNLLLYGESGKLFATDKTTEGTTLLADYSGQRIFSSLPSIMVNGLFYFFHGDFYNDPTDYGTEIWVSDGTPQGTRMLSKIPSSGNIPYDSSFYPTKLVNVNGTLYFTAFDSAEKMSLWKLETPRSELLARNADTGEIALLYLNQQNQVQQRSGLTYGASFGAQAGQPANVSIDWKIAATVDVDRNGVADLLTYSATKDEVAIWNLGQNGKVDGIRSLVGQNGQTLRTGNRDWQVIGMADIDQDKILDVVWHNPVSDEVAFWFMQSDRVTVREYDYLRDAAGNVLKTGNTKWRVEGMSDFDGDGDMDLLFRLGDFNQTAIVRLNGRVVADAQYLDALPVGNLEFRQTADKKVYWQTADNQQVMIQDLIFRSGKWESKFKPIASSGQLQGLMDLDGNSASDLIFRNSLTNGLQFALADARQAAKPLQQKNQTFQFGSSNWAVIQTSDFGNVGAV